MSQTCRLISVNALYSSKVSCWDSIVNPRNHTVQLHYQSSLGDLDSTTLLCVNLVAAEKKIDNNILKIAFKFKYLIWLWYTSWNSIGIRIQCQTDVKLNVKCTELIKQRRECLATRLEWKQLGRVVSASDSKSRGLRSDNYLDSFHGSPEFKSKIKGVLFQRNCGASSVGVLQANLVLSTGLIMWIDHRKEIRTLTFRAFMSVSPSSERMDSNSFRRNVSFRISQRWLNSHYQPSW